MRREEKEGPRKTSACMRKSTHHWALKKIPTSFHVEERPIDDEAEVSLDLRGTGKDLRTTSMNQGGRSEMSKKKQIR